MHPDRVIVHTYRPEDNLSTIPDDPDTLTHQSTVTKNSPRDPRFTALLQRSGIKLAIYFTTFHVEGKENIVGIEND